MGVAEILSGLKNKVLDAATYDQLLRNFELLEANYQLTKDKADMLAEEVARLKAENYEMHARLGELGAEIDMLKNNI